MPSMKIDVFRTIVFDGVMNVKGSGEQNFEEEAKLPMSFEVAWEVCNKGARTCHTLIEAWLILFPGLRSRWDLYSHQDQGAPDYQRAGCRKLLVSLLPDPTLASNFHFFILAAASDLTSRGREQMSRRLSRLAR